MRGPHCRPPRVTIREGRASAPALRRAVHAAHQNAMNKKYCIVESPDGTRKKAGFCFMYNKNYGICSGAPPSADTDECTHSFVHACMYCGGPHSWMPDLAARNPGCPVAKADKARRAQPGIAPPEEIEPEAEGSTRRADLWSLEDVVCGARAQRLDAVDRRRVGLGRQAVGQLQRRPARHAHTAPRGAR